MAWERATSTQLRTTAVFYLGEWAAIANDAKSSPGAGDEARARGDVYGMVAAILPGTVQLLASDQPALAQQFIADTIAALPSTRFLVPNVYAFSLKAYIALYAGEAERAWSLVESEWPALAASYFLRVEYLAIIVLDVRARAALAAATQDLQRHRLTEALTCARKLAQKRSAWAHSISLLIRAGVASVTHQDLEALDLLERAEHEFRAVEMAHFVAACQYRRGTLLGTDDGRTLVSAAEAWAASQGVVNPRRIFEMLAPGCWERQQMPLG